MFLLGRQIVFNQSFYRLGGLVRVGRHGVCIALLLLGSLTSSWGQSLEYQVKAAFLYKFCGYVEWPAQAFVQIDSPISIGVIGSTALTDALSKITTGHTVNGRAIIVRKIQRGDSISGLHILFVTGSNVGRDSETLLNARGQPVLIVTEEDQLPPPDSMINFVLVNDKVRFDIALQPAEQSSLKISARLLAVARKVIPRPSS